jgi:hypothetical protein
MRSLTGKYVGGMSTCVCCNNSPQLSSLLSVLMQPLTIIPFLSCCAAAANGEAPAHPDDFVYKTVNVTADDGVLKPLIPGGCQHLSL